jgi:two-component system, OmpR family, sensor histidine kinase BaeS
VQPRRRPPWWPEDEPWPPERGSGGWAGPAWGGPSGWGSGRHGGGMRRGFGCFVAVLSTLVVSVGLLVLWLLSNLLGLGTEGPFSDLARAAALVVLVAGLIAVIGGIRLVRSVGGPLSELVDAAHRIETADYSARVRERDRGPRDLRSLGRAFNSMAARLETEDATRRRLLADVSHELRTPLAVIQGNLEALVDGVYPADEAHLAPIIDETKVLARLIDDLRTLSLAESGALPLHREPTDVAALLEDVALSHRTRPEAAGATIEVAVDTEPPLPQLDVDPVRIRQVVSNLVENSLRHAPGGQIRLEARSVAATAHTPGAIAIVVGDDGPGIPEDLAPHVFDRFTKSAASRGSGLGLAIAQAIVAAHGGSIRLLANDGPGAGTNPDTGTRIEVRLPLA